MDFQLKDVAQNVGLKPAQVGGLIYLLLQGSIDNQDLIRRTGLSRSILTDFKKSIASFLAKSSSVTALNKEGQVLFRQLSLRPFDWQSYWVKSYPQVLEEVFEKYSNQRPKTKRNWDQFRATKETVFERALLLKSRGDIFGRRLLFIGDADLTSVVAAMFKEAKRIFVVDVDEEVLRLIAKISKEEKLSIETFKYDVRKSLHPHLLNIFDTVFTDPPYTEMGIKLFLSRAIETLELKPSSALYFCYGQSARAQERSLGIQKIVTDMGFLIEERLSKFNRYLGAASIGSTSALYINSITKKIKPAIPGKFTGKIYTWERGEKV
ncbi:hypothetical protein COT63_00020 [Candidatus Shapirobacteria bacterium CG09_land_8_20_14_0_10_38_17]|uniref:N(4)-bis(aminopropyl)spermidine synthase C-terminal domain-containing protein n=1 Tax=Candidatus Shapirobacteria bacterium CG09_land_8_20_14_0_10_38_17 TaxID=1974884 RepID=A0A2H0WS06_9BACT|nr:MAG: hypothetical protein COT63_00020 [Candidatus Shapirobacteria bacterium CG09_land_8_20_14_0_10_38_17]